MLFPGIEACADRPKQQQRKLLNTPPQIPPTIVSTPQYLKSELTKSMFCEESDIRAFNNRRQASEVDALPHLHIITRNVTFDDEFENAPIVTILDPSHGAPHRKRAQMSPIHPKPQHRRTSEDFLTLFAAFNALDMKTDHEECCSRICELHVEVDDFDKLIPQLCSSTIVSPTVEDRRSKRLRFVEEC